jgi:hypothetical protein
MPDLFRKSRRWRRHANLVPPWRYPASGLKERAQEVGYTHIVRPHHTLGRALLRCWLATLMAQMREELMERTAPQRQGKGVSAGARLNCQLSSPEPITCRERAGKLVYAAQAMLILQHKV